MISFGNTAWSHSGLIPLKTSYKKKVELLWAIVSKKNFINLHSAAFVTVFARNLVHAYKFRIFQKIARSIFFINLKIPRSIVNKYTLHVFVMDQILTWHCFQVSYGKFCKKTEFTSKRTLG